MVVLAASICTKGGKAVVSRQFVEMPRARIEGLLASFPKLIGASDQHTFVETETVRYVYQPLEELFMVLVTNKQSNILQDIDTLHLFARSVSEYCRSLDEREIARQSFDLIMVFDEIISLGFRENVGLPQIRTIMEMESHEERVQAEIAKQKEKEANDKAKLMAKQQEMARREAKQRGYAGGRPSSTGFGSGSAGSFGGAGSGAAGFRAGSPYSEPSVQTTPRPDDRYQSPAPAPSMGKGMQLGRKQKDSAMFDSIKADEGLVDSPQPAAGGGYAAAHAPAVHAEAIHFNIDEKISVTANKDGGLQSMEVKGDLMLRVNDPSKAQIRVALRVGQDPNIQYKTHPNVDKQLFTGDSVIGLKDPSKPFPTGSALPVVRWRYVSKDENAVPLAINCWPSPSGNGTSDVNIEYELQSNTLELRDVVISIPYPGNGVPTIGDVEGHYQIDRQHHTIEWQLPIIDQSNKSGVLEFSVPSEDVSAFFPIRATFTSSTTFCEIDVAEVNSIQGESVVFSKEVMLQTEEYVVV
ncbi:Coatomer subunit delta [Rhizophlyctis rosea]|uniref:Coatomer subunit delta n=1 Tax=Rhizophlyctis rosea TaxID=64517 RepID=A0AAD5X503_9FUNG|nr:Coatomer subunit delta [Rhizophlyctis rosea]